MYLYCQPVTVSSLPFLVQLSCALLSPPVTAVRVAGASGSVGSVAALEAALAPRSLTARTLKV